MNRIVKPHLRRWPRTAQFRASRGIVHAVTPDVYDVVIVGGGPAGLALATALAASGLVRETHSVALVEASDLAQVRSWHQPEGTYSNRVSSLTNTSQKLLNDIGAWPHVDRLRVNSLQDMQVWDGLSGARIEFDSSSHGAPGSSQIAHMTENLNLQRALLRRLDELSGVSILDKVKVNSIQRDDAGWPVVQLSSGHEVRARLLVGADGFNSPVKKYAGIKTAGWAYDTHAIVATMNHGSNPIDGASTAYQRFLRTGPIAFLPLADEVSSLVWSTKPQLAASLKAAHRDVLRHMINAAFRLSDLSLTVLHDQILSASSVSPDEILETIQWREQSDGISPLSSRSSLGQTGTAAVGGYGGEEDLPPLVTSIQAGSVAGFPLRMSHAEEYFGQGAGARTVLVGDAAHTVHPLAGQGLNMGLADVQVLADCIEAAIRGGADLGSTTVLQEYARNRYFENHKLVSVTDKLHKLYSVTWPPVVWARSVGLEVVNELDSVKSILMANAGTRPSRKTGVWDTLASGVEGLSSTVQTVRMVGNMAAVAATDALRGALKR